VTFDWVNYFTVAHIVKLLSVLLRFWNCLPLEVITVINFRKNYTIVPYLEIKPEM